MNPPHSIIYVPEGTFGVLDNGEVPVQTADWSNGLVAPMSSGALVVTGIHSGPVQVTTRHLASPPSGSSVGDWEETAEVGISSPSGRLYLESLHDGPASGIPTLAVEGPGRYHLRVHARGRARLRDKVSKTPVEEYLLLVWRDVSDAAAEPMRLDARGAGSSQRPDDTRQERLRRNLQRHARR